MLLFSFPLWWCWLFHKEMNWLQAKGVYKNGHNESNGVNAQYLPGPTLLLFVEGGGSGRVWRLMTATVRRTSCEHDGLMFAFFFLFLCVPRQKNPQERFRFAIQKNQKPKNKCYVCLSVRSVPTYYVNEVDRCCRVQVPVQLVQNDPLHAKNLRRREVAAALQHKVFDGAYYLFKHTPTKKGSE